MPGPSLSSEGWLWLGGSFLLAVLWANLAWFFRESRSGPVGEFVARLKTWRFSPWLLQIARLLYYIGAPAAALLWRRALVERHLGLLSGGGAIASVSDKWADWARDVGWAAALGLGAWVVLALGWRACRRALIAAGEQELPGVQAVSGWRFMREAVYHEVHWAFYRSVPIAAVFARTGDAYWGVWMGLALVALEAALNPAWRRELTHPRQAPALLERGALAVVSSVLFLETGNLWLALVLHWGVSWGLAALAWSLGGREIERLLA